MFYYNHPKPHLNLVFPGWLRIVPPPPPGWMTRISSFTSFGGDTEYYKSKHTTRPHLTMTFWRILQSKHAVRHANILLKSLSGEKKKKLNCKHYVNTCRSKQSLRDTSLERTWGGWGLTPWHLTELPNDNPRAFFSRGDRAYDSKGIKRK